MTAKVKPIPDEYRGATPYLCVKDGTRAIEFYKKAFGAREVMRMAGPTANSATPNLESATLRSCLPTSSRR